MLLKLKIAFIIFTLLSFDGYSFAQKPAAVKVELGSNTAKNGFKNEDEIRDKFR